MLNVLQTSSTIKWLIYPLCLLPVTPPVVLLMRFSSSKIFQEVQIFDMYYADPTLTTIMLFISVPLWFMIYMYLDTVVPSEYGINKHPCFCFRGNAEEADYEPLDLEADTTNEFYNSQDPIRFMKLTKKFGSLTAVDKLKLSIRQGEVFTILGHNGAGKTTALYMLTGVLKPSGGEAMVYGNRITDQMD